MREATARQDPCWMPVMSSPAERARQRSPEALMWSSADRAAVMTACHSLRGACAAVGMVVLADLVASLESAADDVDPAALQEKARHIDGELQSVVRRLAVELGA